MAHSTGYKQIDYVKIAVSYINDPHNGVKADPLFKGVNIWGWNSAMWWDGTQYYPAVPAAEVISYLQQNV